MKPSEKLSETWQPLAPFIAARGITPEFKMSFDAACIAIRRNTGQPSGDFQRSLFQVLKTECGLSSLAEVATKFLFSADEIPEDVDDAPEIKAEFAEAHADYSAAMAKLDAARVKQSRVNDRIARIDTLRGELPHMRESLEFLETIPAQITAEIQRIERAMDEAVYSLPKYAQIGHPIDFIASREARIVALRSAADAHPARIERARAKIAAVKAEIAKLKGSKKKD